MYGFCQRISYDNLASILHALYLLRQGGKSFNIWSNLCYKAVILNDTPNVMINIVSCSKFSAKLMKSCCLVGGLTFLSIHGERNRWKPLRPSCVVIFNQDWGSTGLACGR
ncbi:hypothetical protein TNCT_138361 [Trichonephila clavata]|uniref:Uncharacterized protein n=1 Tax=Trichonephila clavata TaxID=2740835 RepID=A0A8X6JG29_TRICU|nr:hypothetical protein TNCT_138361 [Trichonephila clavata]